MSDTTDPQTDPRNDTLPSELSEIADLIQQAQDDGLIPRHVADVARARLAEVTKIIVADRTQIISLLHYQERTQKVMDNLRLSYDSVSANLSAAQGHLQEKDRKIAALTFTMDEQAKTIKQQEDVIEELYRQLQELETSLTSVEEKPEMTENAEEKPEASEAVPADGTWARRDSVEIASRLGLRKANDLIHAAQKIERYIRKGK